MIIGRHFKMVYHFKWYYLLRDSLAWIACLIYSNKFQFLLSLYICIYLLIFAWLDHIDFWFRLPVLPVCIHTVAIKSIYNTDQHLNIDTATSDYGMLHCNLYCIINYVSNLRNPKTWNWTESISLKKTYLM